MLRLLQSHLRVCATGLLLLLSLLASAPSHSAAAPVQPALSDWTMYHADPARTGYVPDVRDPARLTRLWTVALDGAVYAEPLVVGGRVLVATENDSLYALDVRTGTVQWHVSVGTPVSQSALPCGDIFPLGITGTPVYDAHTGLVFAVAEVTGPAHILFGIDARTGHIKVRRSVDVPGMDPRAHQQRPALALAGNRVYVAYGGLTGDCSDYIGTVVASRIDGTGALLSYRVPTLREGGIWATPGPVIDSQGNIYVTVGNGAAKQGAWDHSDSVLRLSPTLQLEDAFAPTSWPSDNASDADLGSMGPVLLANGLLFADGKSGQGYLLQAHHLGGVGGQIQTVAACGAYGGAAVSGPSLFIPCADRLRQFRLVAGPRIVMGWQAPPAVSGSPIVGGQTVYTINPGGTLYALNAATGAVRASIAVGGMSRFATPALSGTTVFVGTLKGIVAVSLRP
jgi:outer membrane protein assembly factor BamB